MTAWEYTDGSCDVWQLAHLCNFFAENGWEPVAVTDGSPGQKASRNVRDDDGPMYEAIAPKVVLFRRPADWAAEHEESDEHV